MLKKVISAALICVPISGNADEFAGIDGLLDGYATRSEATVENRFYFWDEQGSSNWGYQVVTPLTVNLTLESGTQLIELAARTAFIQSRANGAAAGDVSTLADTVLSGTMTFSPDGIPILPFVSVAANIPTGKETLSGSDKNAAMDRDLVEQTRFGEGWNVNLGAGAIVPIDENFSATIAGSYNWRGSYVLDGDTGLDYDPGEQLTVYGELQYKDQRTLASLGVKYNHETDSTLGGIPFFEPGDSVEVYGQLGRAITPRDSIFGTFSFARFSRNKSFDPFSGSFRVDDARSAGNTYRVGLNWNRRMSFGSIGLMGEFLLRDRNDFDELSDRFLPARSRILFGPTASFYLSDTAVLSLRAQYMRLMEEEFPVTGLERTFNGAIASATLNLALD